MPFNKIELSETKISTPKPRTGQFYQHTYNKSVYLLVKLSINSYNLIDLKDGSRWADSEHIHDVFADNPFTLVTELFKITPGR